jgi:hypothetical protein
MMRYHLWDPDRRIPPSSEQLEHAFRLVIQERYQDNELEEWTRVLDEVIQMRRDEGLL